MTKIVDRIRKLLALSNHNNNAEEAASAAAAAQELMFKYKIGAVDLDTDETTDEIANEAIGDCGKRPAKWKGSLLVYLARTFGCHVYQAPTTYQCVGMQSAIQTISYTYRYLVREIERLAAQAWQETEKFPGIGSARGWKASFCAGATATIAERLQAQQAEQEVRVRSMADSGQPGLVLYRKNEEMLAKRWEEIRKEIGLRAKRSSRATVGSVDGYYEGREAAKRVGLGGGRALNAPNKQVER